MDKRFIPLELKGIGGATENGKWIFIGGFWLNSDLRGGRAGLREGWKREARGVGNGWGYGVVFETIF